MTTITRKGVTVEEAVNTALQTLGVSRDEVKIEIITQGRKGFLGIGAKEAEVRVTKLDTEIKEVQKIVELEEKNEKYEEVTPLHSIVASSPVEKDSNVQTKQYLEEIARDMNIDDIEVSYEVDGKYVNFQLESSKAALLIGKRGQTLNALQQLSQLVANKYSNQFKVVRIDVGDYRERRQQSLEHLADRMADRAMRTGRKVQLEPMPAYERKIIHHALSSRLDIETYSEGSDPYRYLVIEAIR